MDILHVVLINFIYTWLTNPLDLNLHPNNQIFVKFLYLIIHYVLIQAELSYFFLILFLILLVILIVLHSSNFNLLLYSFFMTLIHFLFEIVFLVVHRRRDFLQKFLLKISYLFYAAKSLFFTLFKNHVYI